MAEFLTSDELLAEIDAVDINDKIPAFSGRKYPIEYLDSRDFERLIYFIFQHEISNGLHNGIFDTVQLMKGTGERGRDCILQNKGKSKAVVQCKRYASLVTAPEMAREIVKFCLHAIQDPQLIDTSSDITYFFIALSGFNDMAINLSSDFKSTITSNAKLKQWTQEVIDDNVSLKFKNYEEVEDRLKKILSLINIVQLTGADIDKKLKNAKDVVKVFFEIEKVVDESILNSFAEKVMGFKSNEELENLRVRLQDIPKDKILKLGIFNLYGYNRDFHKYLTTAHRDFVIQVTDVKLELSKIFIDFLNMTIDKLVLVYITGLKEVSPFTKQVVKPYLFNKFALQHHKSESGGFVHGFQDKESLVSKYQTIEQHKQQLLKVGQNVLDNDYSSFAGDESLVALKKQMAEFIHAEFASIAEMSERFDQDMLILQPVLDTMGQKVSEIMPLNGTLIIENQSSMGTAEDFISLLKGLEYLK